MRSPIKSFDKIKEDFIRYYDTAYHINCSELEKERDDLLRKDSVLTREPYIEPMPEYQEFTRPNGEHVPFGNLSREDLGLTDNEITEPETNKKPDEKTDETELVVPETENSDTNTTNTIDETNN